MHVGEVQLARSISAGETPPTGGTRASVGLGLFAASARNFVPRMVHATAVAAAAVWFVGPVWTGMWFALATAIQGYGVWQGRRITAGRPGASPAQLKRAVDVHSFISSATHAVMGVALWRTGVPMAQAFALTATFVSAAYILLQYYADIRAFRLLLAPYVLVLGYIAFDVTARASLAPAVVVFAAAFLCLGNFFFQARRSLDRSRTALRDAREAARRGEQAAEAANATKSTFLATMSHEIRTPLNGVLGMAQAMAADRLSAVQRDRLSVIHRSGEALLAILNDLLDLSKIEAGKLDLESVEFDLGEVARGAYSAFTALANKKGLSFALDIEAARGCYEGDPTRIRQILYNLISNALKFTEQGEIRVTGRFDQGMLELAVADTGVGISPQNLGRLFGKFDQLDSSTTRRFGGTGLGLSICRELVELMGGEIRVESQLGKGSTFTVRLPLPRLRAEKPPAQLAPPPAPALGLAHAPLRVLAAEDNAVNQLVLKTLLHQLGVDPALVSNGADAVEAWEKADWDVILMDIQMPGMDGLTATSQIRERELATGRRRTPIVALTANAMSHQVEQYRAAGMDSHVAKPVEAEALYRALCEIAADLPGAAEAQVA
jgi:signal transduction histidine kinase/ActR/RegA family two-component response regulator